MGITILIKDQTNAKQTYQQSSPNDPKTGTLTAGGTTNVSSNDIGPYTVSFSPADKDGVIPDGATTGTVALVVKVSGEKSSTMTDTSYSPIGAASIFKVDG